MKKLLMRLGLIKRYTHEAEEVMIMKNGVPVGSYIKRNKIDLITGESFSYKQYRLGATTLV